MNLIIVSACSTICAWCIAGVWCYKDNQELNRRICEAGERECQMMAELHKQVEGE